jgi:hypothetical protein
MSAKRTNKDKMSRRGFLGSVAAVGGAMAAGGNIAQAQDKPKPPPFDIDSVASNLADAMKVPRTENSMPGKFPGVVAEVFHSQSVVGAKPDATIARQMLDKSMLALTGAASVKAAWQMFFTTKERIGIKVNPIGGKLLSNSHALNQAIIASLEEIDVPRSNIVLWDRREEQMKECGYTEENYPGIKCIGTEYMVKDGEEEIWKGEDRLDKDQFYEFDIVGEYPEEVMPYMINGGTKSYFSKILTQEVDKVINVPILKNAGTRTTIALKNMAYGITSNTQRGHKIWARYIAEVCAFAAVRDKTVLNIVDALRGCYEGGPGAVARYIWNPKTVMASTDPVAIDHIGWELIFAKRVEEGIAEAEDINKRDEFNDFAIRAAKLGLGVYDREKIDHRKIELG